MIGHSAVRIVGAGALSLLLIGAFGSSSIDRAAAAPLVCAAGTPGVAPSGGTTAVATAVETTPVPTQAPVPAEQNPAGDIPDNQAFVAYTSADGGYTISMPEGWARTENGPNVVFADKLHTFMVAVRCAAAAPTVDSVAKVEAPQLAQQLPAFELVEVKAIDLTAGPAVLVRYRTNSAPDEVTGKQYRLDVDRYELFKDGKLAAISLAVPAGSDNVDVSNLVSQSFRWTA
jgi:hypothetical protein